MQLTPKAQRIVTEAVEAMTDPGLREKWSLWAKRHGSDPLTPDMAQIALCALEQFARAIENRLDVVRLSEDDESDLTNDLYFIEAVESELRKIA
jgi:hypothetical protein